MIKKIYLVIYKDGKINNKTVEVHKMCLPKEKLTNVLVKNYFSAFTGEDADSFFSPALEERFFINEKDFSLNNFIYSWSLVSSVDNIPSNKKIADAVLKVKEDQLFPTFYYDCRLNYGKYEALSLKKPLYPTLKDIKKIVEKSNNFLEEDSKRYVQLRAEFYLGTNLLDKKKYFEKKRCLYSILSRPMTNLTVDEVVKFVKENDGTICDN